MAEQRCKHCQVPLEGARELDEGNGDECLSCMIAIVALNNRNLERRVKELEEKLARARTQGL